MKQFICNSLDDTEQAAKYFSTFALHGNLGFGKTTFTQYLIKQINPDISTIISPTFNIVQTYNSDIAEIWHVDCYRLKSADEFYDLGLEEAFIDCITIIEWPEIITEFLPSNTINILFTKQNDTRIIRPGAQAHKN